MDKLQEYTASQAAEEAEEVGVNNTESPSDVESSGVVLEELTPDEVISQGEEEYGFGLDRLFLKEEKELMETDQEKEGGRSQ